VSSPSELEQRRNVDGAMTIASRKTSEPQRDLFGSPATPEGFRYEPDCISEDDERALAEHIAALPLEGFRFQGFVAKRRVMYFGWRYDFDHFRCARARRNSRILRLTISRMRS
jgi:hypothetical protein